MVLELVTLFHLAGLLARPHWALYLYTPKTGGNRGGNYELPGTRAGRTTSPRGGQGNHSYRRFWGRGYAFVHVTSGQRVVVARPKDMPVRRSIRALLLARDGGDRWEAPSPSVPCTVIPERVRCLRRRFGPFGTAGRGSWAGCIFDLIRSRDSDGC
jgi:hypothetical protein